MCDADVGKITDDFVARIRALETENASLRTSVTSYDKFMQAVIEDEVEARVAKLAAEKKEPQAVPVQRGWST